MKTFSRNTLDVSASIALIAACFLLLVLTDGKAKSARSVPAGGHFEIIRIETQAETYGIYRDRGIWGAHLVQFGRYFHLMPYLPQAEAVPVPFPIAVYDMRPVYEKGLDSHTWLFIANKAGFVRKTTAVLSDADFREKTGALDADPLFKRREGGYRGFSFDMPREIFPFSSFDCGPGPVVVNVDASAFADGTMPDGLSDALQRKCRDIRLLLLIESRDEASVTDRMRRDLRRFGELIGKERT